MDEQQFVENYKLFHIINTMMPRPEPIEMAFTETVKFMPSLKNIVEVKDSSIQGKGVFALQDILPGQIATVYPCHGFYHRGVCQFKDYKMFFKNMETSFYGNPCILDDGLLGHMVNDSARNVGNLSQLSKDNIKNCIEYLIESTQYSNCALVPGDHFVYVKATKPIAAGEELLCSYGPVYWCNNLNEEEIKALLKNYLDMCTESQRTFIFGLMFELSHIAPEVPENMFDGFANLLSMTDPSLLMNLF